MTIDVQQMARSCHQCTNTYIKRCMNSARIFKVFLKHLRQMLLQLMNKENEAQPFHHLVDVVTMQMNTPGHTDGWHFQCTRVKKRDTDN